MFRPLSAIYSRVANEKASIAFIRNKTNKRTSIVTQLDKLKLYNKLTEKWYGPLLETRKQKNARLQQEAKNIRGNQNNTTTTTTEEVPKSKHSTKGFASYIFSEHQRFSCIGEKHTMWNKSQGCVNLVGVVLNGVRVNGFKTNCAQLAVGSSPAEHGYVNEDKILQIKQHQNDYAKQYPSVTLILNKTMNEESKAALEKWKQERIAELGLEEFNRTYQAQMAVGTKFHDTLKNYFTQPRSKLRIEKEVEGVWNSVSDVLKSISSPKAIESNVVHPILKYRGIFDAIADYKDKPTLIEWKRSEKPRKSIALTYDNPVQLAAYFGAVCNDLNYKHFNVRDALLVIAYTDGSRADAYHLSSEKLREHWAQWLIRLEQYMKHHANDLEKRLKGGKQLFEQEIGNLQ